jgi:cytochrome c-type biogenesis protein CcmH
MNIAWIAFTVMIVIAAVGITIPLVRRYDARRARPAESEALNRQLAEIEGQAAAERLPEDVAEGLKTDSVRRFLSEGAAPEKSARPLGPKTLVGMALGMVAILAVGGVLLYLKVGRPDMAQTQAPAAQGSDNMPAGHAGDMIAELEAKMRQNPNDPQGWQMLGWSYMSTGRYSDAAGAYGRAASLDPSNADYKSAQGEALVKAGDGHVSPDALAAFQAANKLDPTDPRARYFLAAAKDQAGDHAGALADWIALLKSAPPGAPWAAEVRGFVIRIAASRGEDVSSKLPPLPPGAPAASDDQASAGTSGAGAPPNGPSADQVAAAQQMPADQQQAMIHGMVDRLAARLKANPRDADGWVSLMRARMVLGDPAGATGAYNEAMKAFAGAPNDQTMLSQAAKQMRVPGA